ncbi:MAG: hypothetical protein ACI4F8_09665 [Lachnospiraceae bacterium]
MSRNRKAFWLMFAGAIVVRGLMAVYMIVNQTYIAEDTITYVNPARELLASGISAMQLYAVRNRRIFQIQTSLPVCDGAVCRHVSER